MHYGASFLGIVDLSTLDGKVRTLVLCNSLANWKGAWGWEGGGGGGGGGGGLE